MGDSDRDHYCCPYYNTALKYFGTIRRREPTKNKTKKNRIQSVPKYGKKQNKKQSKQKWTSLVVERRTRVLAARRGRYNPHDHNIHTRTTLPPSLHRQIVPPIYTPPRPTPCKLAQHAAFKCTYLKLVRRSNVAVWGQFRARSQEYLTGVKRTTKNIRHATCPSGRCSIFTSSV